MKKITNIVAAFALMASISVYADTYDPATNLLTIPTITVDGITYTDVVVTVGRIISIGSTSTDIVDENNRNCTWDFNGNDHDSLSYDLTILPSANRIDIEITGITNKSSFFPFSVDLVQGSRSSEIALFSSNSGILWTSNDGFTGGTIPAGVIKTGTFSRFPSWFNLNESFTWIENGEQFTC